MAAADHGACGFGPLQFGQIEHYSRPSSSRTNHDILLNLVQNCSLWLFIILIIFWGVLFQNLHSQETERLKGITREAPQPFYFIGGGGDLLVNLTDNHPGWKNTAVDQKVSDDLFVQLHIIFKRMSDRFLKVPYYLIRSS